MDGHSPGGISYYLLLGARGGRGRRSKAGLDLDLVATKRWLAPIRLLGTFALKTSCREVQFQATVDVGKRHVHPLPPPLPPSPPLPTAV
jgi:hypothetical protein